MSKKVSVPDAPVEQSLLPIRKAIDSFPLIGTIKDDESFDIARGKYKSLRELESKVEATKGTILNPIKEAAKAANKLFKPIEESIETIIEEYTKELSRYANAKEIARLQELARIEGDKRIKKVETIQAAKEAAGERLSGTMRITKLVIDTPGKVPLKYWVIDEAAVKKALQAGVEIPGARLVDELTVTSR